MGLLLSNHPKEPKELVIWKPESEWVEPGLPEFQPYADPDKLLAVLTQRHESLIAKARMQMAVKFRKGGYDDSFYIRQVLRNRWRQMDKETFYEWFIHYLMLMFPSYNFHEWRQDMVVYFSMCWADGYKEYSTHGASNCQKTSTMAMCGVAFWLIMPEYISFYITSPRKKATDSGIWANTVEFYEELMHSKLWVKKEVDSRHIETSHIIRINDRRYPRGFMQVVTSDKASEMVGRKSKDSEQGAMMFQYDEAPEFKGNMLKGVLTLMLNIKSVDNMIIWASGNFGTPSDLLGIIGAPKRVGGYRSLREDDDFGWLTARGGICRRYDGHYSPNVLAGYNRWSGLNTREKLKDILRDNHGNMRSPGYMRFARSFPVLDEDMWTILNGQMVAKGDVDRRPQWDKPATDRYGFCDPGFGGDPAAISGLVVRGKILEREMLKDHLHVLTQTQTIPLEMPDLDDEHMVTINKQIADFCAEWCMKYRVPFRNFGFDGSMRSGIVQAFDQVAVEYERMGYKGGRFRAIDNQGKPSDKDAQRIHDGWRKNYNIGDGSLRKASDLYINFNTEQHFDVQFLVLHGQLTFENPNYHAKAVDQLCARTWDFRGSKKKVQTKPEYKANNFDVSPTESDVLVGVCQMATRNRFQFGAVKYSRSTGMGNPAYVIAEKNKLSIDSRLNSGIISRKL